MWSLPAAPAFMRRKRTAIRASTASPRRSIARISARRVRVGFYGVIDERFDIELLDKVAEMRPNWSFVMVGPVVKISQDDLPKRPNIHYLGGKTYDQLPAYLSGWNVALM